MWLVLFAILVISLVTCIGSLYARLFRRADGLIALYVLFVALSQIMASKLAEFDLGFATVTAPAAVLIFSVTFLVTDIVNEKFGRGAVHHMIVLTFITQLAMVAFLYIGGELPPNAYWREGGESPPLPDWDGQAAWMYIFGPVGRITLASWITFLISENLDAVLFAAIRTVTGKKHLWARNVLSSIPALTVDTLVFVPLAFAGTGKPVMAIMVGQFATKYVVCVLNVPFMYVNRAILGVRIAPPDRLFESSILSRWFKNEDKVQLGR